MAGLGFCVLSRKLAHLHQVLEQGFGADAVLANVAENVSTPFLKRIRSKGKYGGKTPPLTFSPFFLPDPLLLPFLYFLYYCAASLEGT